MTTERDDSIPLLAEFAEAEAGQAATEMRQLRQLATRFLTRLKEVVDGSENFNDPYVFRRAVEIMGASVLQESMGDVILHEALLYGKLEDQLVEAGDGHNICSGITAKAMGIDHTNKENNCHKYVVAAILDTRGRVSFVIRMNSDWDDALMSAVSDGGEAYRTGQQDLPMLNDGEE